MQKKRSPQSYTKSETYQISSEGSSKYFVIVPKMLIRDLEPFEFKLLVHFMDVCGVDGGTCWQNVRTIAANTKMSVGMVTKARKRLAERGYITVEEPGNNKESTRITVVDKMPENVARYAQNGVHGVNTGVHGVNERITLEENPLRRSLEEEIPQTPNSVLDFERLEEIAARKRELQ